VDDAAELLAVGIEDVEARPRTAASTTLPATSTFMPSGTSRLGAAQVGEYAIRLPRQCAIGAISKARIWPRADRVFADLRGAEPGVPDGMKVDVAGNVYCGGSGGLYILDATARSSAAIVHGQPATTNLGFGGDDWKTLFFTSRVHLGSVNLRIAGTRCRWRRRRDRSPDGAVGSCRRAIRTAVPQHRLFPHDVPETGTPCGLHELASEETS